MEKNMPNEIEEHYSNKENCYREIGEARKIFGSKETTESQYEQMEKSLALMYLYCPEEIQVAVISTLNEATMRKPYFGFVGV
jgi:hypothetical protein